MTSIPWLTFVTSPAGNTLTYHEPLTDPALEVGCKPSIVTFVGRRSKTTLLNQMLGDTVSVPVHKDVFLWSSPQSRSLGGCAPLLVIDCGVQNSDRQPLNPAYSDPTRAQESWPMPGISNFNAALCGRIFLPFSSVLCCFVSDLGGPKAAARWLADLSMAPKSSYLPLLPRVLLIVETTSDTFDEMVAAKKFRVHLEKAMRWDKAEAEHDIRRPFAGSIEVLGLHSCKSNVLRARAFKRRLIAMCDASTRERASLFVQFSYTHFLSLTKQMIARFSSNDTSPFQLAKASRAHGFSTSLLESCLTDFLQQLPSQAWLWHFAAPIIASALLLSSYPPRAHSFPPEYLFTELYAVPCRAAIAAYTMHQDVQFKFISNVLKEFTAIFMQYNDGNLPAKAIHHQILSTHNLHLAKITSYRSCFCCFMRMPEKVVACGHALCDSCIRIFGNRSSSEKNTYELAACMLCGVNYQNSVFRFVPPTAGIRMLTVDGGGIRGVVPLMYLQHLDKSLAPLGCAIRDYFDFVCGTSAGGLVVIGMFLLQWDSAESLRRFEDTASRTFGKRKALITRALQLLIAYVEDGQYSLAAVQDAFKKTFNTSVQMFNPLRNDTKVAVTTTDVDNSLPWLFTNYNGGKRNNLGYDVVRAEKSRNDVTLSDAACCTSAAPWFFKPQAVENLGTYQDGGLHHNNPADIAQWESRFIWPNKEGPDFALSLGTGDSLPITDGGSWWKFRFPFRCFKSFMRSLHGEAAWRRFCNSLPLASRPRYHRLNIRFTGPEPSLDDATEIPQLKAIVSRTIETDKDTVTAVLDSMIASIFYFELDGLPDINSKGYSCSGFIFCRLDLPASGRRYLYNRLVETSSWFLIQGNPISCVQHVPKKFPPFKRRVTFHTDSLQESIAFSIRGITSTPKNLSGFPTCLAKLMTDQQFYCPFGTIDHTCGEKPLPAIPQKRDSLAEIGLDTQSSKRIQVRLR
ncbi:FabD/lysophospholipase-like protein [Plenodomus tracheiphilus IPT5]|uniref:FabD/lysophospholipase-like protein n=1 Tax=Plenodomus tracheiphilus IPT5 TaxID=1408161 RepID=A0A6A7B4Y7_9PLEO|nr:FabD/lysophospholipase-like protein [Plenodomus tracheiphilus IPT5]